ncbi:MAG: hypothetical protein QOH86_2244 [Sphingomonadales bacterium]|nr:hypothetical protein [Sphingomonadales bacterium]
MTGPGAAGEDGSVRLPLLILAVLLAALAGCRGGAPAAPPSRLVLWAWERPEDLRFVGDRAEVAVQTSFIEISPGGLKIRGRRFPLKVARPPSVSLVHVEIAPGRPIAWTPRLRAIVSAAVLHYGQIAGTPRVQVDFEVRESERAILLDVLADVRRGLPKGISLSMTALASWCDTESWLDSAPVDEIVPMLFRLQPGGERLRNRLAKGGDFRNPRCRTALGIATDSPVLNAPAGRRVYLFDPRSWTEADFRRAQRDVEGWR